MTQRTETDDKVSRQNDFSKYFSRSARSIAANPIRQVMLKSENRPDILHLSGGKPHESIFPLGMNVSFSFKPISTSFPSTKSFSIDSSSSSSSTSTSSSSEVKKKKTKLKKILNGKTKEEQNGVKHNTDLIPVESTLDLNWTMNYNNFTFSKGLASFIAFCKELLVYEIHKNKKDWSDYDVCISSGSTDALSKSIELLTDSTDVIFVAKYSYPGVISCARPMHRVVCPVDMDQEGICPKSLDELCSLLISSNHSGVKLKPKVLYTIPSGQNPTTITQSNQRRYDLYKVCRKYDLIILVDDPYYFLQLDHNIEGKYKTYIEIDDELGRDGRVIRMDSFSKVIIPGFRLGFVTARKEFIEKLSVYTQITSWGLSGINQQILEDLLRKMGKDGFKNHLTGLQGFYRDRRDAIVAAFDRHIGCLTDAEGNKLATYRVPEHGMFLWMEVNGIEDSLFLVDYLLQEKVGLIPGRGFSCVNAPSNAFRVSFSCATAEEFEVAAKKIANVLKNIDEIKRVAQPDGTTTPNQGNTSKDIVQKLSEQYYEYNKPESQVEAKPIMSKDVPSPIKNNTVVLLLSTVFVFGLGVGVGKCLLTKQS